MFAKYPLIWTFAGGCLSGAVLIGVVFVGVVREDTRTVPQDVPNARPVERQREPIAAPPVDDGANAAVADDDPNAVDEPPAAPPKKVETDDASHAEAGHSIADILLRLEAAYRQDHAAPSPPATAAPQATPPAVPADDKAAVAVAATPTPPASTLVAAAPPARAPEREAEMRLASREEPTTQNVYYGDVQQNTNVGRVQQGDVYVMPSYVPYAPYYAVPPSRTVNPPATAPYPGIPRAVHFTRNPNPAGAGVFTYSIDGPFKYPVDLVH